MGRDATQHSRKNNYEMCLIMSSQRPEPFLCVEISNVVKTGSGTDMNV